MEIYVYLDARNLVEEPLFMGVLNAEKIRGKEIFSFQADEGWIKKGKLQFLDADLMQYEGSQYAPNDKPNFGLFLDSCPDRWGRVLMQRRERLRAKDSSPKKLMESDYLLGVYDKNRMGALRFKTDKEGPFLDNDEKLATPPITSLRALEQASLGYEKDNAMQSKEYANWVRMLYSPGSSLGGARPKANVLDVDGSLWIAKFPSRNDNCDVGAWEYLVTDMAREFGINVPSTRLKRFSSSNHTFLTKRFDRADNGRIHFASAMTLLGYKDGNDADDGVSYLELAEFLQRYGTPDLQKDLHELWKRILFNVAISNCDDHLRNHGFILTPKGWMLSPAYDLTPNPYGTGLKLNIDETDNSLSFDIVLSTASYYGVDEKEANMQLSELREIVSSWRSRAERLGISHSEQSVMETAFIY